MDVYDSTALQMRNLAQPSFMRKTLDELQLGTFYNLAMVTCFVLLLYFWLK
jgi:hypothetical protein